MKELRVGVVGCGGNSDFHFMVHSGQKHVRLAAVCDIDRNRAQRQAAKWKAEQVYTDYRSMLELDLDLVDVITPTLSHTQIVKDALQSGKNVLVEKPMARTAEECRQMIATAKDNSRTLCVFHGLEFLDSIRNTRAILRSEGLNVSRLRFSYFFAQPHSGFTPSWVFEEATGGILWEALVHHVYLSLFFLGLPESVYAIVNKYRSAVPDSLTLVFRTHDAPTLCEYEWNAKETQRTFQVLTTAGDRFDLDLSHDFMRRRSRASGDRWRTARLSLSDDLGDPVRKWSRHVGSFLRTMSYSRGLPMEKAYYRLIGQLIAYLQGQASAPPTTAEEGLQSIAVLEAAAKSIQTGNVEHVNA
jgi:predicted dehydrogenase